jgi:Smg protein
VEIGVAGLFWHRSLPWLVYVSLSSDLQQPSRVNFRVLGPHERGRFAPEAWGHLLALNGSGALSAADLEHVIERALAQIDGRIALDDLRSLMEGAGFEDNASGGDGQTVH